MGLVVRRKAAHKNRVPDSFVYEVLDGKPLYYKGYKEAVRKKQNAEAIMGSSTLQSFILSYLLRLLFRACDLEHHRIFTNEAGIYVDHKNNLAGDIVVYQKTLLPAPKISVRYADVPAELQLEVDIRAELEDLTETGYIKRKTDTLLRFGTKKLVWIFTATQQVMVAEEGKDWLWIDWKKPVQLWNDTFFCIGEFLEKEGVELES